MTEHRASPVLGLTGGVLTDDRKFGIVGFKADEDFALAIPAQELPKLALLALTLARTPSPTVGSETTYLAFDVQWWNVGAAPDGAVVLTFDMDGGAQLSFQLSPESAGRLSETLAVAVGTGPQAPTPENTH